jgi:hypothetical protein
MSSQPNETRGVKVNEHGVPLRGDGTPFPDDPSSWSQAERDYLAQYYFAGLELGHQFGYADAALVAVNEIQDSGEA